MLVIIIVILSFRIVYCLVEFYKPFDWQKRNTFSNLSFIIYFAYSLKFFKWFVNH